MSQHVVDCPDHEHCTAIYWQAGPDGPAFEWDGKAVSWVSHLTSDVHAEHRLNPDHPATDHRSRSKRQLQHAPACMRCRPQMEALHGT